MNGRPLGLPKTGGRTKGTPNRATLQLKEKIDAIGYDPLIELAKLAMKDKTPVEIAFRCHAEVAAYIYPKRKPVDASNSEGPVININENLDTSGESTDVRDQHKPDA